MPIYAYRCAACGHAKDVLQKISDPVLTVCPACGAVSFQKQVTAAGFQLKGSGWYVTDFRGDSKSGKDGKSAGKDGETAQADSAAKVPEGKAPEGKAAAAPAASESASGSAGTAAAAPAAKPPSPASSGSGAGGQ